MTQVVGETAGEEIAASSAAEPVEAPPAAVLALKSQEGRKFTFTVTMPPGLSAPFPVLVFANEQTMKDKTTAALKADGAEVVDAGLVRDTAEVVVEVPKYSTSYYFKPFTLAPPVNLTSPAVAQG